MNNRQRCANHKALIKGQAASLFARLFTRLFTRKLYQRKEISKSYNIDKRH